MKHFLFNIPANSIIFLIHFYQRTLSPDKGFIHRIGLTKGGTCVFYPTCSDYAAEAVKKHGAIKGGGLALKRIGRCHPWQTPQIDKVP